MVPTHSRLVVVTIAVLLASLSGAVAGAPTSTAQPSVTDPAVPSGGPPDGMTNSTFQRLWAGDTDSGAAPSVAEMGQDGTSRATFLRRVADATDIPFSKPPKAAGIWNRHNFSAYTPGNASTSVHPGDATLADGGFIKDAFVSIYAVQPSTRLHRDAGTIQYIAPSGTVRAISDYRIVTPSADQQGRTRVQRSITQHGIDRLTVRADGRELDSGQGHQAALAYAGLNGSVTLTVEATITATVRTATRECSNWNATTSTCTGSWTETTDTRSISTTVATATTASVASPAAYSGQAVAFSTQPDTGGAVVQTPTPWTTISVAGARIHSPWWFYTATRPGWQSFEASTATGTTASQSGARPLQVHAYPSRRAAFVPDKATGRASVAIANTWGANRSGPQLPPAIDLEPVDAYTAAESLAVTADGLDQPAIGNVTVSGIVAGQSTTLALDERRHVRETALALEVRTRNATHAVVEATVTATASGQPVSTGAVSISGQHVPLSASGQAVATIPEPPLLVDATYKPAAWWRTPQPYSRASATANAGPAVPGGTRLINLVVVTLLWFLPVGLVVGGLDYATGGKLLGLTHRNS